jgi:hypothetical protein
MMDEGPDKLRRRVTRTIRLVQMQFVMTRAQIQTLRTFYNTTVQGTGQVEWTDDLTGESVLYRFVGPPVYSHIEAGQWNVAITWELYSTTAARSVSVAAALPALVLYGTAESSRHNADVAAAIAALSASADATVTPGAGEDGLLLENGDDLLLENGDRILLE